MTETALKKHNMKDYNNLESFVSKQLKLLEMERDAEIEENKCLQENLPLKCLQKKGLCIPKLRVAHTSAGLFGRILIKFVSSCSSSAISAHSITSGDIIGIGNQNSDGKLEIIMSGVVSHVHDTYLTIALEKDSDPSDLDDETYSLIKLTNDITYKRLKKILKTLECESEKLPLVSFLFGSKSPSVLNTTCIDSIKFCNQNLNDAQKEAIHFALSQKEIAILHGPPGTGKTTTLVECILQCVSQKLKIIACAPSNIAVDNLVEKLASHKIKIVRLGHPARVLSDIQKFSLDAIVSQYDGSDVIDDMQLEISKLKDKLENTKRSTSRKYLWAENKNLLREMKERQKSIVKQILTNADVVLSTLTSASVDGPLKHVNKDHFDVCFIDECSQALEIACWIPLALVKKCVIAGDHNQLPPTIISEKAAKDGLSITLMERLLKFHGDSIKKMLTLQYRMHEVIMHWPSKELYENKLIAHESVQSHLLKDLPHVECDEDTAIPLLLIDTAGCDLYESQAEDEESKGNEGEADLVFVHVENLIKSGVHSSDIAVITPYNFQVDLIKSRFLGKYSKLEIKSVDGFQGREKEAVVLSLVRSNDVGEVGFLSEDRRINVAITRAKRHLAVICNSNTVSHSKFLKSFINYCEERGEVRSAFQYESQIGHYPVGGRNGVVKTKQSNSKVKKRPVPKNISAVVCDNLSKLPQSTSTVDEVVRFTTEQKYRKIIQNFIKNENISFSFSPELSAFERRVVHEIAEEFGLIHTSEGDGRDRFINIRKTVLPPPNSTDMKSEDLHEKNTKEQKASIVEEPKSAKNLKAQKTERKASKSCNAKLKNRSLKESSETEDFDALINEVIKADKTCCYDKCKKSVAVLSQVCQFCRGHFCFSHFIPEAHGCGHLAKAHARSQIRKDGALYAGSGKPEKKVDPVKQSYLQKKLNEKISSMTNQRKSKPKN